MTPREHMNTSHTHLAFSQRLFLGPFGVDLGLFGRHPCTRLNSRTHIRGQPLCSHERQHKCATMSTERGRYNLIQNNGTVGTVVICLAFITALSLGVAVAARI